VQYRVHSLLLGRVQRKVGVLQELAGRAPILGIKRDADAGFHREARTVDLARLGDAFDDRAGEGHDIGRVLGFQHEKQARRKTHAVCRSARPVSRGAVVSAVSEIRE
jgi:hypothetical protein